MRCFGDTLLRKQRLRKPRRGHKTLGRGVREDTGRLPQPASRDLRKKHIASEKCGRRKSELLYHEALRGKSMRAR